MSSKIQKRKEKIIRNKTAFIVFCFTLLINCILFINICKINTPSYWTNFWRWVPLKLVYYNIIERLKVILKLLLFHITNWLNSCYLYNPFIKIIIIRIVYWIWFELNFLIRVILKFIYQNHYNLNRMLHMMYKRTNYCNILKKMRKKNLYKLIIPHN